MTVFDLIDKEIAAKVYRKFFQDIFAKSGNAGVKKHFEKATDLKLKTVAPGKYVIVYE